MSLKDDYNRERKAMNELAMRDFDREKVLEGIYKRTHTRIQGQIDEFYMRYATQNGLTITEAHKKLSGFDVTLWEDRAARAVEEIDFIPETNKWLKDYNAKMSVSRLEALEVDIDIELMAMYSEEDRFIEQELKREFQRELDRQAGILGGAVDVTTDLLGNVVYSDFYGANFSERIWGRNGHYENHKEEVFNAVIDMYADRDGYRKHATKLMDKFETSRYEATRLLRTENQRINAQAQATMYNELGYTHYQYIAEYNACPICADMGGVIFEAKDAVPGNNMHPMHPNCRCSTLGIVKMERVDGTDNLDYYHDNYDEWSNQYDENAEYRARNL